MVSGRSRLPTEPLHDLPNGSSVSLHSPNRSSAPLHPPQLELYSKTIWNRDRNRTRNSNPQPFRFSAHRPIRPRLPNRPNHRPIPTHPVVQNRENQIDNATQHNPKKTSNIERTDIEPPRSQDPRDPREDSRFVLDETVECVSIVPEEGISAGVGWGWYKGGRKMKRGKMKRGKMKRKMKRKTGREGRRRVWPNGRRDERGR